MKIFHPICHTFSVAALLVASNACEAQNGIPDPASNGASNQTAASFAVVERGENHRVWESVHFETNGLQVRAITKRYTELGVGMHRKTLAGQWVASGEDIAIQLAGGAAAENGPYHAYFPGSLYDDAFHLTTSDGKTLVSRPLGLSFSDGERNVWIAQLRSGSTGQLLGAGNQVLYTNICTGCRLDLLCTYRQSGYESDLVIRERLPDPTLAFGFTNLSDLTLQWWSEWFDSDQPNKTSRTLADGSVDEFLDFGKMKMARGKAYLLGGDPSAAPTKVAVQKQWVTIGNRTFLVESIPFRTIAASLRSLPPHTAAVLPGNLPHLARGTQAAEAAPQVAENVRWPHTDSVRSAIIALLPKRSPTHSPAPIILAQAATKEEPGFVLDYDLHGALTNFTFQSG